VTQALDCRLPVAVTVDMEPPATPCTSHLAPCITRTARTHRSWCPAPHMVCHAPLAYNTVRGAPCSMHHAPSLAYNALLGCHAPHTACHCRCNHHASSDPPQIPPVHRSTWADVLHHDANPDGVFAHVGALRVRSRYHALARSLSRWIPLPSR
jgi:hypothetical protein